MRSMMRNPLKITRSNGKSALTYSSYSIKVNRCKLERQLSKNYLEKNSNNGKFQMISEKWGAWWEWK